MRAASPGFAVAAAATIVAVAAWGGFGIAGGESRDAPDARDTGRGAATSASDAASLDLRQLAGQRIVLGFGGTRIPDKVRGMIGEGDAAGVVLFSDNFPSRAAGRALIDRLQAIPRPAGLRDPLLVMVDQEGGLVKRVSGAPTASAAEMGSRGAEFSREQGRKTGRNLRNVGVNVDLAPVLDVARPGSNIGSDGRAFGDSAEEVSRTAVAFANALEKQGVASTAKHFPGFGAARENTDFAVQRIRLSARTLRRVDMRPYERFVAIQGDIVMLSTAIYPAFSPKPAAFARPIATGELRGRLGFRGVSVTDALGTVATDAFSGPAEAGVAAAKAGVDLLLFSDFESAARAGRALRRKLREGVVDRRRCERSVQRVLNLRERLGRTLD